MEHPVNRLLIVADNAPEYATLVKAAGLPGLEMATATAADSARVLIPDCNIVLADPYMIREVIGTARRLEWVQSAWAGVDALCAPGLRRDYVLTGVKGVFGPLMAEYVITYLFGLERQVFAMWDNQRERRWHKLRYRHSRDITVGFVGLGSIGRHVARMVKGFGLRVTGLSRSGAACDDVDEVFTTGCVAEFLAEPDYVVMSLPETGLTRGFMDATKLRMMKPSAVLINIGRGSSIVEADLVEALESGVIGGAVLDVFEREPLPQDSPLWSLPNVLITPHYSALSFPADISAIFVDNYHRFTRGEPLRHVVDFEAGY
jgi:phosphoglycerate dehydrogenase-like enzyme